MATIFNLIFNLACSIVGVIFSTNFVNYALCHLGSSQCNNMTLINLIGLICCLPMAFIHNVAPFVYFGGACVCIILVSLTTISGFVINGISENGTSPDYTVNNFSKFPEFFGIACFSLEGIGLIFPIRGSLQKPRIFSRLFTIIAYFFTTIYILFGILCHIGLGSQTKEIVFFNFPKSFTSIYILQFAYALGIFVTFPVFTQTTVNIIRRIPSANKYFEGQKEFKNSCVLRAGAIVFFFMVSMAGINILDMMDFAGAICNSYLSFILPILSYITYFSSKGLISKKSKIFHWALIIIGVTLSCVSVVFAVYDICVRQGHERRNKLVPTFQLFN